MRGQRRERRCPVVEEAGRCTATPGPSGFCEHHAAVIEAGIQAFGAATDELNKTRKAAAEAIEDKRVGQAKSIWRLHTELHLSYNLIAKLIRMSAARVQQFVKKIDEPDSRPDEGDMA